MTAGSRPVALVGPTGSGKSALAYSVAVERGDVELVSVDSMQVYRGMDIGTAKPTAAERAAVRHHLLDLADPGEEFSVARFQAAAAAALDAIAGRSHRAVLVGGTGLYLRAVVDDLELPGRWPEVWADFEGEPDTAALHARLIDLDPVAGARILPSDRRRTLRALEVSVGSGRPFSSFGPGLVAYPPAAIDQVGLAVPLDELDRRIDGRVAAMLDAGLVEEVTALAARPGGLSRTAGRALGYREVLAHLDGDATRAETVEAIARRTRAFARRQLRWFRRDPRIRWASPEKAGPLLDELLG